MGLKSKKIDTFIYYEVIKIRPIMGLKYVFVSNSNLTVGLGFLVDTRICPVLKRWFQSGY